MLQPAPHVGQTVARGTAGRVEAAAGVLHANRQRGPLPIHGDGKLGGLGMLDGIMNSLLDRHDQIMPDVAGHLEVAGQLSQPEAAVQLSLVAEIINHLTDVIAQRVQVVVLRVDRPHRLVEGGDQFPRHAGDGVEFASGFFRQR